MFIIVMHFKDNSFLYLDEMERDTYKASWTSDFSEAMVFSDINSASWYAKQVIPHEENRKILVKEVKIEDVDMVDN